MTRKLSLKKKEREKKAVKLHFKPLYPGGQRPFTTMSPLRPGIFQNPPIWVSIDMDPAMRKSSPPAVHRAKSPSSLNSPCGFIPSAPVLLGWLEPLTAMLGRSRTERTGTSRQEWENGKVNGKVVLTKLFIEEEHVAHYCVEATLIHLTSFALGGPGGKR